MKHLVSLSLGSSRHNFDERIQIDQQTIRITHLGADFDVKLFTKLIQTYDGQCDALAFSYLPAPLKIGKKTFKHELYQLVERHNIETPRHFGFHMRSILMSWAINRAIEQGSLPIKGSQIVMFNGLSTLELAKTLEAHAKSIRFLDPWVQLNIPQALSGTRQLETYAKSFMPILRKSRIAVPTYRDFAYKGYELQLKRHVREAELLVSSAFYLDKFDVSRLKGKTLLLDHLTPSLAARLQAADVYNCYFLKPEINGIPTYNYAITEAIIGLLRESETLLEQDEILNFLSRSQSMPVLHSMRDDQREPPRKFAFIIHPLSLRDLYRHPLLKPLNHLPKSFDKSFEKLVAKLPGVSYGLVSGVQSEANGSRVEGLIYTLFATPRQMLSAEPEDIYEKIVAIAQDAQSRGAKIIGLGAFTKIVGDAGVTIASQSPIPVTTGNSLSAAATLWAARQASIKMGFIKEPKKKGLKTSGCLMIIGATGSIGRACVKVLAELFDDIIIAATHGVRLMELQHEIRAMQPSCQVRISTQPDRVAHDCDLIVIATSATEGGVLSIDKIKPGCVVCDVSRPLTYSAAEATTRPDVLIIESGEIELPGDVSLNCDIGLEKSVVYACLAETALLTMEGRYESFTLSRNVNYKKVKEIYQLAKKHGARLAEIRSPTGIITDQEIELCREHALRALAEKS